MKLSELIEKLQEIQKESNNLAHESISDSVTVYMEDGDDQYEITEVEPWITMGCACWIGADITIKKNT